MLSIQFSSVKYIHSVVQPISRTLLIFQNWNPVPIKQRLSISPPHSSPWQLPISFPTPRIWLLQVAHISGIIHYFSFCD